MPITRRWTWVHTALVAVAAVGLLLSAAAGKWGPWFTWEEPPPARPATAYNLVLTIDSNLIRAQIAMENLVFSENPAELGDQVKAVDLLTKAVERDFQTMSESFKNGNPQFNQALSLFHKWKAIRDEVIKLTFGGPSLQAQEMVREQSAAHVQKIRAALANLERFSKKRGKDFDSKAYQTYREEQQGR